MADAADLKSAGANPCGFESRPRHHWGGAVPWLIIILGYFLGSVPTAYSMALPSLVGFTHFLRMRQRVIRHA